MTTAMAMYRAFGFTDVAIFDGSEAANTVLEPLTIAMELDLSRPGFRGLPLAGRRVGRCR
jgi:hypothetical protein